MAENYVFIKNNKNNKEFAFRGVAPFKPKRSQPTISVPFIGTSPDSTFLFRFTGQTETVSFNFALFNDGSDQALGTHTSTVVTVDEQIDYLMNEIYGNDYDTSWNLTQDRYYPTAVVVNIEDLELDNGAGGLNIVTGSIVLKRGRLGSL